MPLQSFVGMDGSLNLSAATEQMALNRDIYNSDVDGLIADLTGAGAADVVIVSRKDTDANWITTASPIPAFVAFTHDGQLWAVIQGTYTTNQWYSNVTGFFSTSGLGTDTGTFHGDWAKMATRVYGLIRAARGYDPKLPLNVSGHSLGGAVGWMVGALAKQDVPARRVDVMTFGSPRPMEGAYGGLKPDSNNDVQIVSDPIVFLPPNLRPNSPDAWRQQGIRSVINTDGELIDSSSNDGEISVSSLFGSSFTKHLPKTYSVALINQYTKGTRTTFTTALLVASGYLDASWIDTPAIPATPATATTPEIPAKPEIAGGPPQTDVGPLGIQSNIASTQRIGNMSATAFKVTFHYNMGQVGWSEQYYWTAAGAGFVACVADAKLLNNARMVLSPPSVALAGISYQEIPLLADAQSFNMLDVRPSSFTDWDTTDTLTNGKSSAGPASPYNTFFLSATTVNRTRTRIIKLKGIPENYMADIQGNLFQKPDATNANLGWNNVIAQLLGKATGKGFVNQGQWSIAGRIYRRDITLQIPIDDINVVTFRNQSVFQITVTGANLSRTNRVHVGGVTGRGIGGINGDSTVQQVGTVGDIQQVTLKRGPRCGGDILPDNYGHVSLITSRLFAMNAIAFMKSGEAKVGLPHGGTRGRRSAPHC